MSAAERGTALIEVAVVGFAVVALVVPVLLAVLSLAEADVRATTAATDVATWVARHGAMPPEDETIELSVTMLDDRVVVRARVPVQILGVEFTTVETTVEQRVEASVSPYRSDR